MERFNVSNWVILPYSQSWTWGLVGFGNLRPDGRRKWISAVPLGVRRTGGEGEACRWWWVKGAAKTLLSVGTRTQSCNRGVSRPPPPLPKCLSSNLPNIWGVSCPKKFTKITSVWVILDNFSKKKGPNLPLFCTISHWTKKKLCQCLCSNLPYRWRVVLSKTLHKPNITWVIFDHFSPNRLKFTIFRVKRHGRASGLTEFENISWLFTP